MYQQAASGAFQLAFNEIHNEVPKQQDFLPDMSRRFVAWLVFSKRIIRAINFQNPLIKHGLLFADTILSDTARPAKITQLMLKI